MMRKLLEDVRNVQHYIDDCLVHTKTWEEHVQTLHRFLQRVREANLTVRPSKCEIGSSHMEFVGHEIKEGEIGLQNDNVKKIQEAPRPKTKTQVRSFLGLTGYYRNFIPNYASIAMPLTDLTKKGRPNKVVWDKSQEDSFQNLKRLLARRPILRLPDINRPFVLRCDASEGRYR